MSTISAAPAAPETTTRPAAGPRGAAGMTHGEFFHFCNRPENAGRAFELVAGNVIELMSRPRKLHGVVMRKIAGLFDRFCNLTGRGEATCGDAGVLVARDPDTVRGPDVAFFEEETPLEELLEDAATPGYDDTIPKLVVEILSGDDRHGDVARKIFEYLEAGVAAVWVVDPPGRQLTVHRPGRRPEVLDADAPLPAGDVGEGFDELNARVADLFPRPAAPAPPAA